MSISLNELLRKKQWRQAFEYLDPYEGNDEQLLTITSLLCRLLNEYEREIKLIEHCLSIHPMSEYMLQRKQWHDIPWFERLEARPTISIPRGDNPTPQKSTLDKLCIVSAADENYFQFLVECIESIKATKNYNDVDIKIIDVGLNNKEYFIQRWGIEPIVVGWPIECKTINFFEYYFRQPYNVVAEGYIDNGDHYSIPCDHIQYTQAVLNKPFLYNIFPEYDYFLWIDADCWVQDESGLDKLLCITEHQGYAFPGAYVPDHSSFDLRTRRVPDSWHTSFSNKPTVASSLFCTSKEFQATWANQYLIAGNQCGFWWGQEEEVASYCMEENCEIAGFREVLYLYRHLGLPVVKEGENALRDPETLNIIPIFGLGLDKHRYFYPVFAYQGNSIEKRDLLNCIKAVGMQNDWSKETPELFPQQKLVSFRFRCLSNKYYEAVENYIESLPTISISTELDTAQSYISHLSKTIKQRATSYQSKDKHTSFESTEHQIEIPNSKDEADPRQIIPHTALQEAQILVDIRDSNISQLESELSKTRAIVLDQESDHETLESALREAQETVCQREIYITKLENSLNQAQMFVRKKESENAILDKALQETQQLVVEKNTIIESTLREAEETVCQREVHITKLENGLNQAQIFVRKRESENAVLDKALQEAQQLVVEKNTIIETLKQKLETQ